MRSVGLDLGRQAESRHLRFIAHRPSMHGLEVHLAAMHREIELVQPQVVVIDPISSLLSAGLGNEVQAMLLRLIDYLKARRITALFTNLTHGNLEQAKTDVQVSSLMDTWLLLMNRESNGEHNRELYLLKSRGMAHSNQLREFLLSDDGIQLRPVYMGPGGVLTGSARLAQEAREAAAALHRQQKIARRERELVRKRRQLKARIEALQAEMEVQDEEMQRLIEAARAREERLDTERQAMAVSRQAEATRAPK
jgi:circadian clock protein KaiC